MFPWKLEMIEKFKKSESQQNDLENAYTYVYALKRTKYKYQCWREKESRSKTHRKCAKKNHFQAVCRVKKKNVENVTQEQCGNEWERNIFVKGRE